VRYNQGGGVKESCRKLEGHYQQIGDHQRAHFGSTEEPLKNAVVGPDGVNSKMDGNIPLWRVKDERGKRGSRHC